MSKFAELDAKIIDAIQGMNNPAFGELLAWLYPSLSVYTKDDGEVFRTLDKRLQALRKKGAIVFMRGWRVVPAK